MFDRVTVRVADLAAAERFYCTTLSQLGIEPTLKEDEKIEWNDFAVARSDERWPATGNLHVGFAAATREQVDAFWRSGIEAGFEDDDAPGERPQYTPGYYGAFLCDPGGNSAEAVLHDFTQGSGHIDHLWIRVEDVDVASAFYAAIQPHAGLREGRRWDAGRQFRGSRSTFSLVADGAPPTESLQISFPATGPQTVEAFRRAAAAAGFRVDDRPRAEDNDPGCQATYFLSPGGTSVGSVFRSG